MGRKGSIYVLVITSVFCIWLVNQYIKTIYDVNIFEYIYYSQGLTIEEKAWLEQHGDIVYGADKSAPPLRYVDSETNQYKGVIVDYLSAMSLELGMDIKVKPFVWQSALTNLEEGATDICDLFPSEQRSKKYLFSKPIYNIRGAVLLPAYQAQNDSKQDLKGKRVATVRGDYAVEYLNSEDPNIELVLTDNIFDAIVLLQAGTVDAVMGDEPVIGHYMDKMALKDSFKLIPMFESNVVLAVPKTEKMLVQILNKGIFILKTKSTLEKIQQKWLCITTPVSQQQQAKQYYFMLMFFILIFTLGLYILYFWNEKLKAKVAKRTEELNLSRDDLQKTFDGITYFMIVFDEKLNVMNANKAFCKHVCAAKDLIGRNYNEIGGLNRNFILLELIRGTFADGRERAGEYAAEGQFFQLNTFPLFDKDKRVIKVVASLRDITELKLHEKQLLQESKMAAIGQLAAVVAHEIRNPLGLIRSYAYILRNEADRGNDKVSKALEVIDSSVERASGIISNLLNFSCISNEQNEWVNIIQLTESIVSFSQKIMQKNKILLHFNYEQKIICYINSESLKHILINLISNALDAMPGGGDLEIRYQLKANILEIHIQDTGVGISKEHLEKIFQPFFTTKPGKGTGLGLFITYNEIKKFGGDIYVTSEINKGTTFKVVLPLKKEQKNEDQ